MNNCKLCKTISVSRRHDDKHKHTHAHNELMSRANKTLACTYRRQCIFILHVRIFGRTIYTEYHRVCRVAWIILMKRIHFANLILAIVCVSSYRHTLQSIIGLHPPTRTHKKPDAHTCVLYPFVSAIGHGISAGTCERARRKTKHHKTKLHNNLHPKRLHTSTHAYTHEHTQTHEQTYGTQNPQRIRL